MRFLLLWFTLTLVAPVASAGGPCGNVSLEERFGHPDRLEAIFNYSKVVVLARVIDVVPSDDEATLVVLKSWKGPFAVDSSFATGWPTSLPAVHGFDIQCS